MMSLQDLDRVSIYSLELQEGSVLAILVFVVSNVLNDYLHNSYDRYTNGTIA